MIINTTDLGTLVITQPATDLPAIRISLNVAVGGSLPSGGTEGQVLRKVSSAPYDAIWAQDKDAEWGQIVGDITEQSDLITALNSKQSVSGMGAYETVSHAASSYYPRNGNPSGFLVSTDLAGLLSTTSANALYYPLSANPAAYLTASSLSGYITAQTASATFQPLSAMGAYETTSHAASTYYPIANPAGYITANVLDDFLTTTEASEVYQTQANMAYYIRTIDAADAFKDVYYPLHSNPANYLTASSLPPLNYLPLAGGTMNAGALQVFTTDTGGNDSEVGAWGFGVERPSAGKVAYFEPDQIRIYDSTHPFGMALTAAAITFPDQTQQTTAAVTADLTPYETTVHAANTYQTLSGMASYATQTYVGSQGFITGTTAAASFYPLNSNPAGYLTTATLPVSTSSKTVMTAYNQTGAVIPKGAVIYISSAHGNDPQVSLSQANSEAASAYTIGVAQDAVANNSNGTFITSGLLENFATSTFGIDGTPLYLSPTVAGGLTATKPFAPYHYVRIGTVVRSHPTAGTVFINITNGFQLDEMSDVASTAPLNNNVLTFESSSGMWKDKSVTTALGYVPANIAGDTFTGKLNINNGLTAVPLNIGSNVIPASSVAGDIWIAQQQLFYKDSLGILRNTVSTSTSNSFTNWQNINQQSSAIPSLSVTQTGAGGAVLITNTGAGYSLKVEDAASPDATPFVIDANGRVGIGVTPDATVALTVDSTGIKFSDASTQVTAFLPANYLTASTIAATYAPLASPTFTGDPKAPTPLTADNDTSIATTAFVKAQGYLTSAPVTTVAGRTGAVTLSTTDISGLSTTYFPFAGGQITGRTGIGIAADATAYLSIAAGGIKFNTLTFNPTSVGTAPTGSLYAKELLLTINGVNYAIPARLV